ncbi:MAG: ABC transporter permease, partial [bacterium]
MFGDLLKMVFIQIKKRKLRTFLTMVQVMIGIATIALVFNLIFGLWGNINDLKQDNIYKFEMGKQEETEFGSEATMNKPFSLEDINYLRENVETITGITPFHNAWEPLVAGNNGYFRVRNIGEVGPEYKKMADISMVSGSFFTEKDFTERSKVVVIEEEVARRVFSGSDVVDKKIDIYPEWRRDENRKEKKTYTVIGVFSRKDEGRGHGFNSFQDNQLLTPDSLRETNSFSTVIEKNGDGTTQKRVQQEREEQEPTYSEIYIKIEDGQYASTKAALSSFAREKSDGEFGAILEQTGHQQSQNSLQQSFKIISIILSIFGLLIIVIGSIGILSTMMVNILERTRQIGIEKALGASRR